MQFIAVGDNSEFKMTLFYKTKFPLKTELNINILLLQFRKYIHLKFAGTWEF